ncbi:MAG: hypothetical protein CMN91_05615 [Synechococcus sp. ARS1019]|nr:hypothetical protein [Synechococcus sp. ARS1019]|tara:strand:+ start:2685 stop:3965 length:1281 start_codon:yes stop_codon:yes gene_type:complete
MAVVAVVDSGLNVNHNDIKSKLWRNSGEIAGNNVDDDRNGVVDDLYGYDVITGQAISEVGDPDGHGTHVAGIVATTSPKAEIMGIRILDANGSGNLSDAVDAFSYALLMGATVINNSWGALGVDPSQVRFLQEVIDIGVDEFGAVFVAAAGNETTNTDRVPNTPSNAAGMLSVGASDSNGNPASFSNFGQNTVDLFAPGVNILSADTFSTNGRIRFSGTSMASPVVAGAAAILQDRKPNATPATIKRDLLNGVVPQQSLQGLAVTEGVLANKFTKSFTSRLKRSDNGDRKEKSIKNSLTTFNNNSKIGNRNFDTIICVLDKPTRAEKMDLWNELMDQDYTKKIEWPKAFGNRICVLNLKKSHQTRENRMSVLRDMRKSGHFESVEWDRTITQSIGIGSSSVSPDAADSSSSTYIDLIASSAGIDVF